VRYGVTVTELLRERDGRVCGVIGHDRSYAPVRARSWRTDGADGVTSTVARLVGAPTLREGQSSSAIVYGYWSGLDVSGYEWFYRPGGSAGLIPTNGGEVCVFAGVPARALAVGSRGDLGQTYHRLLAAATDGADGRLAAARPPRRLRAWIGRPSFVRRAHGPGWVLVGDAGSFLDPLSTHGITDALRDAEMLARALGKGGGPEGLGGGDISEAAGGLDRYATDRDRLTGPMFDSVERIASYDWDSEQIGRHLRDLSSAMSAELELIVADGYPAARADSARAASGRAPNVRYE
jgi:flavin-dependent dehydrogenase